MKTGNAFAKAAQPGTAVNFEVPPGACDSHTHIHPDPTKFPMFPGRVYTPELASPEEMTALHKALHMERVVIVTPSVYGTDNSATLFGMKARGATARGVAVIDEKTPEGELDAMNQAGAATKRAGTWHAVTVQKVLRIQEKANVMELPLAALNVWRCDLVLDAPQILGIQQLLGQSIPIEVGWRFHDGHMP